MAKPVSIFGKDIRPELLERTDLAPLMAKDAQGDSHTFMGVKLAPSGVRPLEQPTVCCRT